MLTVIRARLRDDAGIGMILVLGITVFVAGLTVTAATIAQNGLGQSRQRINFERSMASAESGIDYALGHLQYAFDEAGADYPIPSADFAPSSDCPVAEIELPDLKNVNEKQWAKAQLKLLAEEHPECLIDTPDGQVMVLKPKNSAGGAGIQYGRVYAMGWSPGYGHPKASSRTVKAEYVFMPYRPKHAILTGQSLTLQSTSTDVMGAHGVDPKEASVHTNGDLTVIGQPTVTGPVSYSGSATGSFSNFKDDTATKKKDFRIPKVSAVGFYKKAPKVDPDAMLTWTDLCPNGEAKAYSSAGPCTGGKVGESPYKGWSFNSGTRTWTASKDTASGTYFVHHADVANGTGNGTIPNLTVIASAEGTGCTGKQYGNIVWDHYDTPAPAFNNLFFMADGDLEATSNFYSGQSAPGNVVSGMYVAGEEIRVFTSSSGLVGAILAANQCPNDTGPVSSNEVQGQIVKFDPKSESPFSSLISTTLWLEYVG
jgi:hypothetical protein